MADRVHPQPGRIGESPLAAQLQVGHGEISSTIALDATLERLPSLEEAESRLRAAWSSNRPPEGAVDFEAVAADSFQDRLQQLLNRHIEPGQPLCRFLFAMEGEPRVAVVSHHSLLDGRGLLAALSAITGERLATTARGVDPAAVVSAGLTYGIRRLGEALMSPPTRIAPDLRSSETGDHLVRKDLSPTRVTTAALVAAAAGSVIDWNRARGRPAHRIVVAVGAARGGGASPSFLPTATWLRLRVSDPRPEAVRQRLETTAPEPQWRSSVLTTMPGTWLAGRLARRTGSTMLVSNLGGLEPAGTVRASALYPAAHGRSGVAIGCVTAPAATVVTLRARRADFSGAGAINLLQLVVDRLRDPPVAPQTRGAEGHAGVDLRVVPLTSELLQEHMEDVLAIETGVHDELGSLYSDERWGPSEFLRDLPGKWTYSAAASAGGRVRGFWLASLKDGVVHSHRAAVEPSWRGRGAGSALFGFVLQKARREGIGLLTLSVPAENRRAVRFHERHGFSPAKGQILRRLLGPKADRVVVGPDYYETPEGRRYYLLFLSLAARRPERGIQGG